MPDDITRSAIARGKPISAARAQALVEEIERLQADAAAYRQALETAQPVLERHEPCGYYCDEAIGHIDHPATYMVVTALNGSFSGVALLAELEAARRVIAAARAVAADARRPATGYTDEVVLVLRDPLVALRAALAAYDAQS